MHLANGARLGSYEISAPLGAGGMGEVYRARDTKLGRDVAIKVLPRAFADDAARMARFEREAQVLASLNHPNIASIYGIEQGAIVMELVEGEDLAGPVPVEKAVNYARQIAAGLEAAHEKGIVHRDLKPANIKITAEGLVKILDFGLAATKHEPMESDVTRTISLTESGFILGTAAYMSPEQAAGKAVDKRADIWAFGVVLYEMLTGKRLFTGETAAHTLANVMAKEFDVTPAPRRLQPLLKCCLERDPRLRLRDIGDARLLLDSPSEISPMGRRTPLLPWATAAAALAIAALAVGGVWMRPKPAEPATVRFPITMPDDAVLDGLSMAVPQVVPSPDGRLIALALLEVKTSQKALWVRPLGSATPYRVEKSEGAGAPFWSPDSKFIGFFTDKSLKKVAASGGVPLTIASFEGTINGASWSADGTIVFAPGRGPLRRVAAGGSTVPATTLQEDEVQHAWPQFLPDGKRLIYFALSRDQEKRGIYLTEAASATRTLILKNATRAVFAPPNYLLFVREGTLLAQEIHPTTFELKNEPLLLAPAVMHNLNGNASFAASSRVLVFRTGTLAESRQLVWYGRDGKRLSTIGAAGEYASMSLSPDDTRAALVRSGSKGYERWLMHLSSQSLSQLSDLSGSFHPPVWSPDSQRVIMPVNLGIVMIDLTTGAQNVLSKAVDLDGVSDWLPDGRFVVVGPQGIRLWNVDSQHEGASREVKMLLAAPALSSQLRVSPDRRSVAYASVDSGGQQVYLATFPEFGDRRQISTGGGAHPLWRRDGRELFFLGPGATIMSANVAPSARLEVETPKPLFKANLVYPGFGGQFGVSRDGQRFLIAELQANNQKTEDMVVVNWASGAR